jgi:hypothetical protein
MWPVDTLLAILPGLAMGIARLDEELYSPPLPQEIIRAHCLSESVLDQSPMLTFFITMVVGAAGALFGVKTFGQYLAVFRRERLSGLNVTAFWLGKVVFDLWAVARSAFVMLAFFMMLASPRGTFGQWFAIVFSLYWASYGLGENNVRAVVL